MTVPETVKLYRAFGLHASADALENRLTCRTCAHLESDPREKPCAGCKDFDRWEERKHA